MILEGKPLSELDEYMGNLSDNDLVYVLKNGLSRAMKLNKFKKSLVTISGGFEWTDWLSISSADYKNMHTTDFEIVPAPGADLIIWPLMIFHLFHEVTTPYSGGTDVTPFIDDAQVTDGFQIASITPQTASVGMSFPDRNTAQSSINTDIVNKPLVLRNTGTAFTAGDGVGNIRALYTTIDAP